MGCDYYYDSVCHGSSDLLLMALVVGAISLVYGIILGYAYGAPNRLQASILRRLIGAEMDRDLGDRETREELAQMLHSRQLRKR